MIPMFAEASSGLEVVDSKHAVELVVGQISRDVGTVLLKETVSRDFLLTVFSSSNSFTCSYEKGPRKISFFVAILHGVIHI